MKNKQLFYMAGVIVVLLAVYLLLQRSSVPVAKENYLFDVDTSKVSEVTIYSDGQTVTLNRNSDGWKVTNPFEYEANTRYTNDMLKKMMEMRVESDITSNKDKWNNYEVGEDATRISFVQNGKEHAFYIGKTSSSYQHTYMREEGKDQVVLVKGTYGSAFKRKADLWKDKSILDIEQTEIMTIKTDDYELFRNDASEDVWHLKKSNGDTELGDLGKVSRVISAVSRLQTSNFPEEEKYKDVKWNKATMTLEVLDTNGKTHLVRFFKDKEKENAFFVKLEGSDNVFRVFQGVTNQIFKKVNELLPEKAEG